MKRTTIILSACLAGLLPFSFTNGQEKKNEDKIKIIIADKDGTKTIIDTTFTGDNKPDSIMLKNGSIVYIGNRMPGDKHEWSAVSGSDGDNYYVYSGSDEENTGQGKKYKVITRIEKDGNKPVSRYIYVNSDRAGMDIDNEKFDISVDENESDNDADIVRHVIAKDGLVVTIEGADESKVQALAKEIEKTLGVSGSKSANDESGKTTVKKK